MTTDKQITDHLQQAIIKSALEDLLDPEKDDAEALDTMSHLLEATLEVAERNKEEENESEEA